MNQIQCYPTQARRFAYGFRGRWGAKANDDLQFIVRPLSSVFHLRIFSVTCLVCSLEHIQGIALCVLTSKALIGYAKLGLYPPYPVWPIGKHKER
jgi:hypothetical protein